MGGLGVDVDAAGWDDPAAGAVEELLAASTNAGRPRITGFLSGADIVLGLLCVDMGWKERYCVEGCFSLRLLTLLYRIFGPANVLQLGLQTFHLHPFVCILTISSRELSGYKVSARLRTLRTIYKMPRPNDSPDVATSKSLAYILRHGAEKESLHIRSDGYIKLDDVVRAV